MIGEWYPLIIYILVMLLGRAVSQGQRKANGTLLSQSRAIFKDWTASIAALSAAVAIALPVSEYALRETPTYNICTFVTGLAIVLAGYSVAYAANRAIRENWSPTIDKTQEQNLITSGVYSMVRHPLYLSGLIIIAGTNIYFRSSWAWLGAILVLMVILIRLPIEEQLLVERFGKDYIAYRERTKAILPWIL